MVSTPLRPGDEFASEFGCEAGDGQVDAVDELGGADDVAGEVADWQQWDLLRFDGGDGAGDVLFEVL